MTKRDPAEILARAYALQSEAETRALYRDWAATYDETMLDGLGYLTPSRTSALLAAAVADPSAPVLDVGSGTGLAGVELAARGFANIDALDYSPEMLAQAAQRGVYRNLFEADLNKALPLPDAAWGALISTGTFTHGHVGAGCLPELFRLLAPGGLFAATVHRDVWEPSGFGPAVAALEASGVMTTVSREAGPYYAASTEPDGWYVLWRRAG